MKKLFIFSGVLFFMFFSFFLQKRQAPLIPRGILFGNPAQASPQISPDGKQIAYLAPDEGVLNIWVQPREGGTARAVTRDRGRGIRQYFWAPDSRHLFYLQDQNGNENTHLYLTDLSGKETRNLTPFEGVKVQVLKADKNVPDQILISMNRDNPQAFDVYRLYWKTGEFELSEKNSGNVSSWVVDSQLHVRGKVVSDEDARYRVFVRGKESDGWREAAEWGIEDNLSCRVVGFSKSGEHLYLIDSRGAPAGRLVALDLETGAKNILAGDENYDVVQVLINPDSYEIEKALFVREKQEWLVLSDAIRPDVEAIEAEHGNHFSIISRDNADRMWILRVEADTRPPAYFLYDRAEKRSSFLFEQYPELKKYRLAPMRPIELKARDGLALRGYLTLPLRGSRKHLPLILKVHGGPWSRDVWAYDPQVQWLANRGYAVLQVNFRGSTTYGKAFLNAGNKEWGRKMQDDLTDAVLWAVSRGFADKKRVAIYGTSYGGYAALAGAAFTPELYRAGIAVVGPSNLVSLIRSIPPYWTTEAANIHLRIGSPEKDRELLEARSPLNAAENIRIPLLIAQGGQDPRVPRKESEQIVDALKKHGISHQYLVFEDEGHGFVKPENRMKFFSAMEFFLEKYLGGRAEA